jgi:hypothetical protein
LLSFGWFQEFDFCGSGGFGGFYGLVISMPIDAFPWPLSPMDRCDEILSYRKRSYFLLNDTTAPTVDRNSAV